MKKLLIVCLVLLCMGTSPRVAAASRLPDIILIVTDDQNADTLWAMPSLQSVASRGTIFTNAFASTPLCCPARASLLTGQYAHDTEVLRNSPPHGGWASFDDTQTLAVWAQSKGYRTALFGKYMNGYQTGYTPPGWSIWCPFVGNGDYYGASFWCDGEVINTPSTVYSTDFIFDHASAFIQESKQAGQPYFVMITPRAPHGPMTPEAQDTSAFSSWSYDSPAMNEDTSDKCPHLHGLPTKNTGNMQSQARRQLQTLLSVDRGIASLETLIDWQHTIFVYTSDQGYLLGDHRLNDKGAPYERAIRIPLVMVIPGGVAGQTSDSLIIQQDITRTIVSVARLSAPVGWQWAGRSYHRTLLYGEAGLRINFALMQFDQLNDDAKPGFIGIRDGRYKLVEFSSGCREFYDLQLDVWELDNQIANPAYATQISTMLSQLKPIRARMDMLGWKD